MSTPTRPVNITSPSLGARTPIGGSSPAPGNTPLSGTPNLQALRAAYSGTPPPVHLPSRPPPRIQEGIPSTPGSQTGSGEPGSQPHRPSVGGISARRPGPAGVYGTPGSDSNVNASSSALDIDDLPDEEKAKVLRRHLVAKGVRNGNGSEDGSGSEGVSRRSSTAQLRHALRREDTEVFPVPYHAPGADVTHDIYKWQRRPSRPRAVSFSGSTAAAPDPAFEHIHEPGGFRRNYLLLKGNGADGAEGPRMLNNFIDFLYIFGHFAGEDLEEIEEEDEDEADDSGRPSQGSAGPSQPFVAQDPEVALHIPSLGELQKTDSERTPLLSHRQKSRSASRRRRMSVSHGDATVGQAILMLLKSFVGTGVLFLGKAFLNGGILFSLITISVVALVSLYSFLLLVKTKFVVSGSFGDLGGKLYGPWMRYLILSSIAVSQLGFVSAYIIFVAENLQSFIYSATKCVHLIPVSYLILMQIVVFIPMSLIRNLAKLSTAALVADVFIVAGLIYIFGSELGMIKERGIAKVELFNPKDFALFIGTAVFSFEGIGLVIPITDSMREPHKFPPVLSGVMIFLLVLFGGAGALSYLTFGPATQTVVLVNLDTSSRLTQAVQFLYSLAIMLSVPLQLFPAVRIMENGIFGSAISGKVDGKVKWEKNGFRFLVVMFCTFLSWVGANDLDKFVSFVGSFACVPLCYVYPAMLHYKACARTRKQKAADIALMVFGMVAAAYTTVQTVLLMATPEAPPPPLVCGTPPPL